MARLGFAAGVNRAELRAAQEQKHFDVAELFAFVCPAREAVPTPRGLARALGLAMEADWKMTEISCAIVTPLPDSGVE